MADILPGFEYSRTSRRYRDQSTGRYVARADILGLLDTQTSSLERRLGGLTQALAEGNLAPSYFAEQMRTELRRAHLQQIALAVGGWDRTTPQQFGRAGRQLRDDYARVARLAADMQSGNVTLAQALNRVQGYAGSARLQFWQAEREAARETGLVYEERRRLGVAEHCEQCVALAALGWQPLGVLPPPCDGSTPCGTHCRCTMERREVREQERVGA